MGGAITNWGEALFLSLSNALSQIFAAVPRVLGFIIILLIGWFISGLLEKAVAALLRAIRFNDLADRSGLSEFVQQMGIQTDTAGMLGNIVKWFVRLIVLVVAFDALGLPAVSQVLQQLLLWLPNLVVALVVLVIGGLAANALANLVQGATKEAGFNNSGFLASIARVAIWSFAIVVAVNQLGVAQTLVNTLFIGLVGALALALGLSFGLGGRDTAGEIVRTWYQQGQAAAPKLAEAAKAAQQDVQNTVAQQSSERKAQPSNSQIEQAILAQMRERGGGLTVNKERMQTHWQIMQQMESEGRIELVSEDAERATYKLPS